MMAKDIFYHANGKKVPLRRAKDFIAVSRGAAPNLPADAIHVGKLSVVPKAAAGDDAYKAIEAMPEAQAVYQYGGTLMVPLPEVRIEDSRPEVLDAAEKWLHTNEKVTKVVRDDYGIAFVPVSGSADDAVALANDAQRKTGAETAQPNFLRLTQK
jgi:hypothetical protein